MRKTTNAGIGAKAIIVFGPSGAGKDFLAMDFIANHERFVRPISATTRGKRPKESNKSYYFVSRRQFAAYVRAGKFVEHVTYSGNSYGVLRSELERVNSEGRCPVFIIDYRGVLNLRRALGSENVRALLILPPSMEVLEQRLLVREGVSVATPDHLRRLQIARREMELCQPLADRLVINRKAPVARWLFSKCIHELARELELI